MRGDIPDYSVLSARRVWMLRHGLYWLLKLNCTFVVFVERSCWRSPPPYLRGNSNKGTQPPKRHCGRLAATQREAQQRSSMLLTLAIYHTVKWQTRRYIAQVGWGRNQSCSMDL